MSEFEYLITDDRNVKVFLGLFNRAPKIKNRKETEDKSGLPMNEIYPITEDFASRHKTNNIIVELEDANLVLRVSKKFPTGRAFHKRYEVYVWDNKTTALFYQMLGMRGFI